MLFCSALTCGFMKNYQSFILPGQLELAVEAELSRTDCEAKQLRDREVKQTPTG